MSTSHLLVPISPPTAPRTSAGPSPTVSPALPPVPNNAAGTASTPAWPAQAPLLSPSTRPTSFRSVSREKLLEKLLPEKEPPPGRRPSNKTAVLDLYGFLLLAFLIFACAAFRHKATRYVVGAVSILLLGGLLPWSIYDEWFRGFPKSQRQYSRNLGNTVVITLVAIMMMPCLYVWRWEPGLHSTHLVLDSEQIDEVLFPSFALFQRLDWTSDANLYASYGKCFINWYDSSAPACPIIPQSAEDVAGQSCNCSALWSSTVEAPYTIDGVSYRILRFGANATLRTKTANLLLWAQTFFDYDAVQASSDNGWLPAPGVSIAMHDPMLTLEKALATSRTRLIDLDASAVTSINVGLRQYVTLNGSSAYDYDLSINPRTSRDLVCNTGNHKKDFQNLCAATLQIRVPAFLRTTVTEERDFSWSKIVVEAGAWLSFAQILGWTLSGAAFAL